MLNATVYSTLFIPSPLNPTLPYHTLRYPYFYRYNSTIYLTQPYPTPFYYTLIKTTLPYLRYSAQWYSTIKGHSTILTSRNTAIIISIISLYFSLRELKDTESSYSMPTIWSQHLDKVAANFSRLSGSSSVFDCCFVSGIDQSLWIWFALLRFMIQRKVWHYACV